MEPANAEAAGITCHPVRLVVSESAGRVVWEVHGSGQAGQLLLVTYQLCNFRGQGRDDRHVRMCSAAVRVEARQGMSGV